MGANVWRYVRWYCVRHSWTAVMVVIPLWVVGGFLLAVFSLFVWDGLSSLLQMLGFFALGLVIMGAEAYFKRKTRPWERPEEEWVRLRDEHYGRDTWPHRRSRKKSPR